MKYRNKFTEMTVTVVDRSNNRIIVRDENGNRLYLDNADFAAQYTLVGRRTA
jgi:hypothetical protein